MGLSFADELRGQSGRAVERVYAPHAGCEPPAGTIAPGSAPAASASPEPDIVALPIQRRRIVNLEEERQKVAIADEGWVELDLDGPGVRAMVPIHRTTSSRSSPGALVPHADTALTRT